MTLLKREKVLNFNLYQHAQPMWYEQTYGSICHSNCAKPSTQSNGQLQKGERNPNVSLIPQFQEYYLNLLFKVPRKCEQEWSNTNGYQPLMFLRGQVEKLIQFAEYKIIMFIWDIVHGHQVDFQVLNRTVLQSKYHFLFIAYVAQLFSDVYWLV